MNLEKDYVKYGLEFSLSLFAVSSIYLIDLTNPITLAGLLLIPVLLGYTAFISRENFQKASLASLISLFMAPVSLEIAVVALALISTNILTSFFSGGGRAKDFYSSTSLPLLLTGILIGGIVFSVLYTNEDFQNSFIEQTSSGFGEISQAISEEAELVDQSEGNLEDTLETVSRSSVDLTRVKVLNQTEDELQLDQRHSLESAFVNASSTVPEETVEELQIDEETPETGEIVRNIVERNMEPEYFLAIIPILAMASISFQPFIGLLTAFFAVLFRRYSTTD